MALWEHFVFWFGCTLPVLIVGICTVLLFIECGRGRKMLTDPEKDIAKEMVEHMKDNKRGWLVVISLLAIALALLPTIPSKERMIYAIAFGVIITLSVAVALASACIANRREIWNFFCDMYWDWREHVSKPRRR